MTSASAGVQPWSQGPHRPHLGMRRYAGRRGVQRRAEAPRIRRRRDDAAAGLLGRHVLLGPEARPHLAGRPGDAQVDQRRLAAVRHHVGGPDVEVEVAVRVQVLQRRRQLPAEVGQVGRRQPPRPPVDDLLQVVAHQRLDDHHRDRFLDHLEPAHQVRVAQRGEQAALQQQAVADARYVGPVRADRLGHGAAQPRGGEHGVHVERLPAGEQLLDDVAGSDLDRASHQASAHSDAYLPPCASSSVVRALLDQPPLVQHEHVVGALGGGQVVRDDQGRAALHQPVQRPQHPVRRAGVEGRGRLVEHQHRGVAEQSPRDGDPLGLAAGEPPAALADAGVVPVRQQGDEPVGVRGDGGRPDGLLGGLGPAVGDVVADRAVDEQRLLEHDGDVAAQAGPGQVAQVVAVEQHPPGRRVERAQQQPGQRGLAGPAGPDDRGHLTGAQHERDVLERGRAAGRRTGTRPPPPGPRRAAARA